MVAISPAINANIALNTQNTHTTSTSKKQETSFIKKNFTAGGLVGDFANVMKLTSFWATSAGVTNPKTLEATRNITSGGALIKNYLGVVELPEKVSSVLEHWDGLKKGTQESVEKFADSIFGTMKNLLVDGTELAGRFKLMPKETIEFFGPVGGMGAFSFGATQLRWENIPAIKDLQKNWETESNPTAKLGSNLLKVAKHAAIAAVGALVLIAKFFMAIPKMGLIIPSLLTIYTLSSISSRFFDELALPKPKMI